MKRRRSMTLLRSVAGLAVFLGVSTGSAFAQTTSTSPSTTDTVTTTTTGWTPPNYCPSCPVPELDPSAMLGALTLASGGLLLLADRRASAARNHLA